MRLIEETLLTTCDEESRRYCKSFNGFEKLLREDEESIMKISDIDLSALGLYLCKCVEREINSTVVQFIREYLGIEMPEYYCKPCMDFYRYNAGVNTGRENAPHWIYFNDYKDPKHRDSLKLIPLGDAYQAAESLHRSDPFWCEEFPVLRDFRFRELWRGIYRLRNEIAHAGNILSHEDLVKCYDYCREFLMDFMPGLSEIKDALSPDGWKEASDDMNNPDKMESLKTDAILSQIRQLKDKYNELYSIDFHPECFLFKPDGCESYGIVSRDGNELVPCIIDSIESLIYGIIIRSGEKYGLYSSEYNFLVPAIYDNILVTDVNIPYVFVIGDQRGCISKDGRFFSLDYILNMEEDDTLEYVEKWDLLMDKEDPE